MPLSNGSMALCSACRRQASTRHHYALSPAIEPLDGLRGIEAVEASRRHHYALSPTPLSPAPLYPRPVYVAAVSLTSLHGSLSNKSTRQHYGRPRALVRVIDAGSSALVRVIHASAMS